MHRPVLAILASLAPSVAYADPAAPATPACPPTVIVDRGAPARYRAKWLAGAGATLAISSVVLAAHTQRQYEDFGIDRDDAENRMWIATGLFVTGAVGIGLAAYYYFGRGQERVVKTAVAPLVDRERIGLALAHRF
jgi:hypothetical protein